MTSHAVVENAKVFPLYAKRLSSHNVKEYTLTANKLKHWLSSEKAYYPDALRSIISLLEIAHSTLVNEFMNTESSAPAAVDIYQALICAVIPFSHSFGEGDLQVRLKVLIKCSSEVLTHITRPVAQESSRESSAYSLQDLTDRIQGRSNYPIASGGFGDIWKCMLVNPNEVVQVAVKTIRAFELEDDASMRKKSRRVRRELKVWGRLKHDCILPLWGVANGFGPYPAMICPWVLNGTLTGFLVRQQDMLSPQDKFSLLNDIALGLQYLHSKSIVHGDLTGSNVLVQGNGRACLADFGLSKMVLEFINPSYFTSSIKGNVRWAAAELFKIPEDDKDNTVVSLSIECDIYSFGSIALQALTCKVPYYYVSRDNVVLGHVIRGKKPEPPKESQIAPLHWELIQRCWLSRACRPTAGEIVTFIACERDALVS